MGQEWSKGPEQQAQSLSKCLQDETQADWERAHDAVSSLYKREHGIKAAHQYYKRTIGLEAPVRVEEHL